MGDFDLHRDLCCLHDASRMDICAYGLGLHTGILPDQRLPQGMVTQEDASPIHDLFSEKIRPIRAHCLAEGI
jgi:hypothetical protein